MRHTILLVLVAWTFARGQDMPSDDIAPLTRANLTEGRGQARKIQITGSFWIAYGVRVKPNLAIDTHEVNVPWDPSIHGPDVSVNVNPSTPELGVFVRYVANKEAEIEVLNLRRKHHFGAIPVFWLGQEPDGESLDFLQALLKTSPDLATGLVRAIGIHRDERSADVLKAQAMLSTLSKRAHEEALCWIGQSYGQASFLYHIANNATPALDERSAAVLALLESPDPAAQEVIARFRLQVNERRIQDLIDRYRRGGTKINSADHRAEALRDSGPNPRQTCAVVVRKNKSVTCKTQKSHDPPNESTHVTMLRICSPLRSRRNNLDVV